MDYPDLLAQIQLSPIITPADLCPGDHVAVTHDGLIKVFTIKDVTNGWAEAANSPAGVSLNSAYGEWRLLLRPKKPLPTEPGSRIVAWTGSRFNEERGLVLRRDGSTYKPWGAENGEVYDDDEITEWAPLPDDHFNELRKESHK